MALLITGVSAVVMALLKRSEEKAILVAKLEVSPEEVAPLTCSMQHPTGCIPQVHLISQSGVPGADAARRSV